MSVDPTLIPTIVCSYGGRYDTSYITQEEANTIAGTKFNRSYWDSITEPQKVAVILSATRDIDSAFNWVGSKYFYNQNLEFPRKLVEDIQDAEPDDTFYEMITTSQYQMEMKRNVKLACFEQALWIARMSGIDVHSENQRRGITSYNESYGSVSESYSYRGAESIASRLCPEATYLLRRYRSQPKLVRG